MRCLLQIILINLNSKEYYSGKFDTQFKEFGVEKDFSEAERTCSNILSQKEDGSCVYLDSGKCSIHSKRPSVCRKFFCNSKDEKFKGMIEEIEEVKG